LLVDRYALSLAPSASVAAAWWSSAPRRPLPRLIAFGDPIGVRLTTPTHDSVPPRLPDAAREVRSIARLAPRADVFVGSSATEAELRRARLADVGVLHFATHAEVDEWSLQGSSLLLAPGGGDDGRVTGHELAGLRVEANLVVLAACSSGSGAVLAGEGLQGLTAPFLEAGASSVVATLWQIGDRSSAPLIEAFYAALASGASVGDALHRAKRAARARGVSPAVWAAFTLTGDSRVRTALREPRALAGTHVSTGWALVALLLLGAAYFGSRRTRRRNAEAR
jgi:CHAT domain-containing protein